MSKLTRFIKFTSPVLMTGALILDFNVIYLYLNHNETSSFIKLLSMIATLAIIIHFIEGIIAGLIAKSQQKNYLKYGVYTFFIGTIALFELLENIELQETETIKNKF